MRTLSRPMFNMGGPIKEGSHAWNQGTCIKVGKAKRCYLGLVKDKYEL